MSAAAQSSNRGASRSRGAQLRRARRCPAPRPSPPAASAATRRVADHESSPWRRRAARPGRPIRSTSSEAGDQHADGGAERVGEVEPAEHPTGRSTAPAAARRRSSTGRWCRAGSTAAGSAAAAMPHVATVRSDPLASVGKERGVGERGDRRRSSHGSRGRSARRPLPSPHSQSSGCAIVSAGAKPARPRATSRRGRSPARAPARTHRARRRARGTDSRPIRRQSPAAPLKRKSA